MNTYFFDRANAVDRENRIREASEEQQLAAQLSQVEEKPVKTIVLTPQYRRSFAMSVMILVIGVFALFILTTPAGAQSLEPSGGYTVAGRAQYIFIMGNYEYVRENYEKSVELFQESIDMIPVEFFEQVPDYAHMYMFLGRSQLAAGMETEALDSFILYVEYSRGDALPEILDYVKSHTELVEVSDA